MTEGSSEPTPNRDRGASRETAVLGGGCFWCVEEVFRRLDGVIECEPGYMGGELENPTYEQVCTGLTGHAEVVRVVFDPGRLPYERLLRWFFRAHDPTTKDRQGADIGPQYRSVIFTFGEEQERVARRLIAELDRSGVFGGPIVTEVRSAGRFWPAEDYHRAYYRRHPDQPYCRLVIAPKLEHLGLGGEDGA